MRFIGIDLGTSSVKLLLMEEDGTIVRTAGREYPLCFPQSGWSEQEPDHWWEKSLEGIKELLKDTDTSLIGGIGIGGQMHGLVILDEKDRVIRPAILWNDGRTVKETAWLNTHIGHEKLSQYTANIAFAGFTAPKLLWLRANEPENFAAISKIMLPKDYLVYRLTGVHACDYSDASGMLLLDVRNRRWSQEMLEICGISEKQMPKLFESYESVGVVSPKLAKALGLPENVTVCAGAGDNAAAAVGTGTVGDGACNLSLGTSGTVFITAQDFRVDENNALHAFAHADGKYHLMGCMLSAASCNRWFMEDLLQDRNYAALQQQIAEDKLGRNHVYFLPYLMGERSPHNDPLARAAFVGMTMDSTRADLLQAVMEGVAFGLRDCVEVARSLGIRLTSSKLCGGGARSPLWRKILANVLDLRLDLVETEEGPAYGGAILAAVARGCYPSVEEATKKIVRITGSVSPDGELKARYEEKYQTFKTLYPTLRPLFPSL